MSLNRKLLLIYSTLRRLVVKKKIAKLKNRWCLYAVNCNYTSHFFLKTICFPMYTYYVCLWKMNYNIINYFHACLPKQEFMSRHISI